MAAELGLLPKELAERSRVAYREYPPRPCCHSSRTAATCAATAVRHPRVARTVQAQGVLDAAVLAIGDARALGELFWQQAELGRHAEQRDIPEIFRKRRKFHARGRAPGTAP